MLEGFREGFKSGWSDSRACVPNHSTMLPDMKYTVA